MELRQLAMFVAVSEEGSFTAAARRIGTVQSAVSTTVRALERELGHELFERSARGVALTDAGEALLPEARRALAAVDAARDAVDAVRGGLRGTVRLGAISPLVLRPIRLPALLARFRADHPRVEIRLVHGPTSTEKVRQLRDGQLDLAVVGLAPPPPAGVTFTALKRERMQLACHRSHPLADRSMVEPAELTDLAFVDGPPGSASRVTTDAAFAALGLARTVGYEINDTGGMVELVASGLAIAILPPSVAGSAEEVVSVPLGRGAPLMQVSLAMPANRPIGAAAQALAMRIESEAPAA